MRPTQWALFLGTTSKFSFEQHIDLISTKCRRCSNVMYPQGIVDDRDGGVMTTRRRMTARQSCKHCYFRLTLAANMAQRTFANRLYDSMGEEQTNKKKTTTNKRNKRKM